MSDSIKKKILDIVMNNLSSQMIKNSIVYFDQDIKTKGTEIDITSKQKLKMPYDGYMVFIDEEPKANWGHPTIYYLINSKSYNVEVLKDIEFPPYSGNFDTSPKTFKVLLRYGEKPPNERYFNMYD